MSNDPWAFRFPPIEPGSFDHRICELQVGRDLYEVWLTVSYIDERDWSVVISRFEPSYELEGEPATTDQIEAALDADVRERERISDAVLAHIRDRDEEAREYRAELRRHYWEDA